MTTRATFWVVVLVCRPSLCDSGLSFCSVVVVCYLCVVVYLCHVCHLCHVGCWVCWVLMWAAFLFVMPLSCLCACVVPGSCRCHACARVGLFCHVVGLSLLLNSFTIFNDLETGFDDFEPFVFK